MNKLLIILFIVTLCLLGGVFLAKQDTNQRNFEYAPQMAYSMAYLSQSPNPFLPDSQTQQNPVTGTIAYGVEKPLHFRGTHQEEELQAAASILNPFGSLKGKDVQRGKKMYQVFCQVCHGADGQGNGPVAQHGFPPPPSLLSARVKNFSDGQIFYIISYGYKNMPSYHSQITSEDRWQIIEYVRKLQESKP